MAGASADDLAPLVPLVVDTEAHAELAKLLGCPELVRAVLVECSTWRWVNHVARVGTSAPSSAVMAREQLRKLRSSITRNIDDLQQLADVVAARIEDAAHALSLPARPLDEAVARLVELLACIDEADRWCAIDVAAWRAGPQTLREHALIAMVLRVLPPDVMSRSTASNSKLVRLFALLYALVGLPLNVAGADGKVTRPRDHLKSYFKAWGETPAQT